MGFEVYGAIVANAFVLYYGAMGLYSSKVFVKLQPILTGRRLVIMVFASSGKHHNNLWQVIVRQVTGSGPDLVNSLNLPRHVSADIREFSINKPNSLVKSRKLE